MELPSYKASAPGTLMLFGEHAVLHGEPAIAAAVDKRITVQLMPRTDRTINIISKDYAACTLSLDHIKLFPEFKFIIAAIQSVLTNIPSGFDLHIDASFAANLGLGSSAAVTVATLAVLNLWIKQQKIPHLQLYSDACKIIRHVQGVGSGADVAAAIFGGVIAYQMQPLSIEKIATTLPLTIIYSGSKKPTPEVIAQVNVAKENAPQTYAAIFTAIGCCVRDAISATKQVNYLKLGQLMNVHQGLHEALGVNTPVLSNIIWSLRAQPEIYGAKISGSGMGDCVIALGTIASPQALVKIGQISLGSKQINAIISDKGLEY